MRCWGTEFHKVHKTNRQTIKHVLLVAYGILMWEPIEKTEKQRNSGLKLQLMTIFMGTGAEFWVDSEEKMKLEGAQETHMPGSYFVSSDLLVGSMKTTWSHQLQTTL